VVAPLSRDQQEAPRQAVALETVLLEHTLGAEVVGQRSRFDPVEAELGEREVDHGRDRARGETAPVVIPVDPVGEDRGLKRATNDVAETDEAGGLAVIEDQPAMPGGIDDACTLRLEREELLIAGRIERREKLSVGDVEVEDDLRIRILEPADDQNRPSGSDDAVEASSRRARRPRSTTSNLPCSAASAMR
jgi:hypothetical protein